MIVSAEDKRISAAAMALQEHAAIIAIMRATPFSRSNARHWRPRFMFRGETRK